MIFIDIGTVDSCLQCQYKECAESTSAIGLSYECWHDVFGIYTYVGPMLHDYVASFPTRQ